MTEDKRRALLPPTRNAGGCLLRVCWMLYGTMCILLCFVLDAGAPYVITKKDIYYWLSVIVVLVLARLDVSRVNRQYDSAQADRVRRWRRLTFWVLGFFAALWLVNNFFTFLRVGPENFISPVLFHFP